MTGGLLTRRSVLRSGAIIGSGVGAAGLLGTAKAFAAPAPRFDDDFTTARDGPLNGRVSSTGHQWKAIGADSDPAPVIYGKAIGPPAGHIPGASTGPLDTNPNAAAGYGIIDFGAPATSLAAQWRWDRSTATVSSLCFGAFSTFGVTALTGASAHLAIWPGKLQFAVFTTPADFTVLVPQGRTSGDVYFPTPQLRDGRTLYNSYIAIVGNNTAVISIDGLAGYLVYQDLRIGTVPGRFPFFEYFSTPGGTNLPRFTRVAAQR